MTNMLYLILVNLQVYLVVFGTQEQKPEHHGWMQLLIQIRMQQNIDSTANGTFPVIVGQSGLGQTTYFEHEVGTDQVNPNGTTTTVTSSIESYDIDLEQRQRDAKGRASGPKVAGEVFLAVRRFIPDFKTLQGNSKIVLM